MLKERFESLGFETEFSFCFEMWRKEENTNAGHPVGFQLAGDPRRSV